MYPQVIPKYQKNHILRWMAKNGLDGTVSMPLALEVVQAHLCALSEIILPAAFLSSSDDVQVVPYTL
jgi:hypothetical protein